MTLSVFDSCLAHLSKHAEEQDGEGRRYLSALKHVGAGVLGYGAGTAAGKGLGLLASKVDRGGRVPGAGVARTVAPLAGAGLGVAYSLWKAHENEAIQRALKGSPSNAQPGLPGQ